MKHLFLSLFSTLFISTSIAQGDALHTSFNTLLKKHVSTNGAVNYNGFKADRSKLESYIKALQGNQPKSSWNVNQKLAYWINLYNANTILLMVNNWPVKSIKEINKSGKGPWDIAFIKAEKKLYSLNNIENGIIRKRFNEPRIHFAVNCAAKGCPNLRNEAFLPSKLAAQLTQQTKRFLADASRNKISSSSVQLSKIFEWYKGDFTKKGSLIDFINKYNSIKVSSSAKISFLEYNWAVNN